MMTSTASVQVNLDIGADPDAARRRWRLLHAVGPAMVASFANSPVHAGVDTGWKSARQRVWQELDHARTSPPVGADPAAAWADYSLDARVMLQRRDGADWTIRPGPTFRDWLGRAEGPSAQDLALHLTTLFPPVRPRGWFEVRYLDAQPWRWWPVPMAVLSALLDDPVASEAAAEACGLPREGTADPSGPTRDWVAAARDGLEAPGLQTAARACFDAALTALAASAEHPGLVGRVAAFRDRYVSLGRSPADDPLEVR
jgi:glutamate--cysteine ligase